MECNHFDFVRFLLLVSFHFQVMERKRSHLPKKWRFILHNREALEGPFNQRWMTQNKIKGKMNCLLEAMPFEHPEESSVFFLYSFVFYPGHIFSSLSKYCIMHESITTIFKETARYDWNFILLYTITCFFLSSIFSPRRNKYYFTAICIHYTTRIHKISNTCPKIVMTSHLTDFSLHLPIFINLIIILNLTRIVNLDHSG